MTAEECFAVSTGRAARLGAVEGVLLMTVMNAGGAAASEPSSRPAAAPKRIVICLDGTWNHPAQEKETDDGDEVFKPTNVLKTARAVKEFDDATGRLSFTRQPAEGETVTIAGKTYRFESELSAGDGNVRIGDEIFKSLENLRFAIDRRSSRDRYSEATVRHPIVSARAVPGDRLSLEIVARPEVADGDPFATATTVSGAAWADKSNLASEHVRRGLEARRGVPQIAYYDSGVGGLRKYPGFANAVHRTVDNAFGGAAGAGFEANIEEAYRFLALNYREGDEIFVFGFSRGASSARGLARFVDWMGGILPSRDAYWIPRYFDAFLRDDSLTDTREAIRRERVRRRIRDGASPEEAHAAAERVLGVIAPARIKFLGVWESVLALGGGRGRRFIDTTPPAIVDHARQALAIDERRADFLPKIWLETAAGNPNQTLLQRWFPGVHTNVGGGYVNDGLANLALEWMLDEASLAGLGVDAEFSSYYPGYPQDQLYDSSKLHWRIWQTITFRRNKGAREIVTLPDGGLTFHPSVFLRLASPKTEPGGRTHDKLESYRPRNLLRYLASVDDLDALFTEVGLPGDFRLPTDVLEAIERAR